MMKLLKTISLRRIVTCLLRWKALDHHLPTVISSTNVGIKEWISNHIHMKQWGVIIHPCANFINDFVKFDRNIIKQIVIVNCQTYLHTLQSIPVFIKNDIQHRFVWLQKSPGFFNQSWSQCPNYFLLYSSLINHRIFLRTVFRWFPRAPLKFNTPRLNDPYMLRQESLASIHIMVTYYFLNRYRLIVICKPGVIISQHWIKIHQLSFK